MTIDLYGHYILMYIRVRVYLGNLDEVYGTFRWGSRWKDQAMLVGTLAPHGGP